MNTQPEKLLPNGLIILVQSVHDHIPEVDILQALPETWFQIPRKICRIIPAQITHGEQNIPMSDLMEAQRIIVQEKIQPILKTHPDYEILYFGMAPIPLCIHLGYLMGPLTRVRVFHKHHKDNRWRFSKGNTKFNQKIHDLPLNKILAKGEVIIRYESSKFTIHEKDCLVYAQAPLSHVYVEQHTLEGEGIKSADPFINHEEVLQAASNFGQVLDTIFNHVPNTSIIHLFASVQPNVAFLMGKLIYKTSQNIPIQLYQYHGSSTPAYIPAGQIPNDSRVVFQLTPEAKRELSQMREKIQEELTSKVQPFVQTQRGDSTGSWLAISKEFPDFECFDSHPWSKLKGIWETNLMRDKVQLDQLDSNDRAFYNKETQSWLFNDYFLFLLKKKFQQTDKLIKAIRLLWFHESIHFSCHNITPGTSRGIGGFPKILEELDYQADVYAMLNEYAFARIYEQNSTHDLKAFFLELLQTITQTMWAFDEMESKYEMELRRINRYIIWYYQYASISAMSDPNLLMIVEILSQKPLIELRGLNLQPNRKQRHLVRLQGYKPETLEIALLIDNKIVFKSSHPERISLEKLVEGLRERNGEAIIDVLKNIIELTSPL